MMTEKIRQALKKRMFIEDEWDYGVQQSWKEVLSIISGNFDEFINYIENDCTASEFSLLSEVYNEIIDIYPTTKIIDALRKTVEKYPQEAIKYNLIYCIDEAEGHLNFISYYKNNNNL